LKHGLYYWHKTLTCHISQKQYICVVFSEIWSWNRHSIILYALYFLWLSVES